jgi:hypothetical protein
MKVEFSGAWEAEPFAGSAYEAEHAAPMLDPYQEADARFVSLMEACAHNAMAERKGDPAYAWQSAHCDYVYGAQNGAAA